MHFLLTYELQPDYLQRRGEFRTEHLSMAWKAVGAGQLLLGGALSEPSDRALLLFTDAAAAKAFAEADPYVRNGLVARWRVQPWNTVVGEWAASPVRP